jgi:hypothetical protein
MIWSHENQIEEVSMDRPKVTSKRAAEIVGIGYEGFRSYLKRGLLGRTGMLPGFHRPGAATSDDPAPRSGWQTFGLADLCLMRLAKMLMDSGFSFESANSVVSQYPLWDRFQHGKASTDRYLLLWPPFGDHMVFETEDLALLPERMKEVSAHAVATLINLRGVQQYVEHQLGMETEAASR